MLAIILTSPRPPPRGRDWNENVLVWPGLREHAETAISCRGPGPARKKKEVPAVGRRRKIHRFALVVKHLVVNEMRVELTLWETVKCTRRNGVYRPGRGQEGNVFVGSTDNVTGVSGRRSRCR